MRARRSPRERWQRRWRSRRARWGESLWKTRCMPCAANRCRRKRRCASSSSPKVNNDMTRLNVGLIGVGRMGRVYARDLSSRLAQTRLAAVADTNVTLAREVAAQFDVPRAYAEPLEL